MVEYTLFEKIQTLFNLITSTPLFLVLLLGIALMIIDMMFISKKDKKTKIVYALISAIIIILFINSYFNSIKEIFDAVFKNIISIIYFPTMLEYIVTLVISFIILIISVISKKINKIIKRINIFVLSINTFLLFLIIDQINGIEIDLSNKISVYSNSVLMILLELSLIIFVIWIIGLLLYKIISGIISSKKVKVPFYEEPKLPNTFEELQMPKLKEEINKPEFTLDEYKQMSTILDIINKKKD